MALIEIENVDKWFGRAHVLVECSANIEKGEVVVVCGPSGSGKSTLIRCINGLETIQKGRITVDGVQVHDRSTNLPSLRSRLGMLFQSFELYPHLTLLQNVTLAPRHVRGLSRLEAESQALSLLRRVGLALHAHKYPGQLSGGQQQRGAIARSLAMNPAAMLFDEPTSALDPEMIQEVLDVMSELAADGMTMIIVTHEMGFARAVADRVLFMDQGRIVAQRPTDEFFDNPPSERARMFLSKTMSHGNRIALTRSEMLGGGDSPVTSPAP
jgi:glutamate/aspartate transport system ATP-binding protein